MRKPSKSGFKRLFPKKGKWFNKPSPKGSRKERFMKEVKGY